MAWIKQMLRRGQVVTRRGAVEEAMERDFQSDEGVFAALGVPLSPNLAFGRACPARGLCETSRFQAD